MRLQGKVALITGAASGIGAACVDLFAQLLGLKGTGESQNGKLKVAEYMHKHNTWFDAGDQEDYVDNQRNHQELPKAKRQVRFERFLHEMHKMDNKQRTSEVVSLMSLASRNAFQQGYIQDSPPWKEKFGSHHKNSSVNATDLA